MSDGWETKRRRGEGHDWCVIKLGKRGVVHRVEVDTSWFKGNYPESCSIEACHVQGRMDDCSIVEWKPVLTRSRLCAHTRHFFEDEIIECGPITHVRFNIFPDGGVSRLRIFGRVVEL